MRKTIALLLALWTVPAFAVGTIPGISLSQQLDSTGKPLGGGLIYLIQAGTTSTPQNCYQDTGLSIAYPNPVTLDAYGRAPQLFCADGQIKIRLTDRTGVQVFVQDNLLVIGASSGGGGGGTVDPTTILATGDFKLQYNTGPITGFVRCNGRTIGSATSGATERANADTSALYAFLWGVDANLAVTGGRGASGAADFAANKPMALPDCRGRVMAGLDDMGNSAAGRLTSTYFGSTATTLGAANGSESQTLGLGHIPATLTVNGTVTVTPSGGARVVPTTSTGDTPTAFSPTGGSAIAPVSGFGWTYVNSFSGANTLTANNTGSNASGGAKNLITVQPTILATTYIKL